jgi:hypothetical protein
MRTCRNVSKVAKIYEQNWEWQCATDGGTCRAATSFACAAGTLGMARFLIHERFRRLTLRSATGF